MKETDLIVIDARCDGDLLAKSKKSKMLMNEIL